MQVVTTTTTKSKSGYLFHYIIVYQTKTKSPPELSGGLVYFVQIYQYAMLPDRSRPTTTTIHRNDYVHKANIQHL
jgi:hypothetical protein